MEISLMGWIGIGLAAMFFGYFFGLFEGRSQGFRKRQKEEGLERQVKSSLPPQASPVVQPGPRDRSLLDLSLEESGKALLHIDGRQVDAGSMAPEMRKRLIELMVLLRPWVEPPPTPASMAARVPVPDSSSSSLVDRLRLAAARDEGQPVGAGAAVAGAPEPPVIAAASMSLVAQIDSILQARLAGTPLADRGIRLAEALHGGAVVFIGKTQYDGVDKVPDPEIQAAIRSAIAEWEKKYTPS